ncbi:MAG TPA: dTDP-4-dehydrorhamnose reductase [Gemmatimonadales bacterium]|nr:dTDP-4-dehydrorhamnose reductase [Gemmatimonadales bacterium]
MLLGAGGMLGRDLAASAPPDAAIAPFTHGELDLLDEDALVRALEEVRPDVVLNAAAYTAVDRAESERERALAVNGAAPGTLGRHAAAHGARVVHFSTDYVFDGEGAAPWPEDAPLRPINYYGETKLEGERRLLASGADALILRTQWLFGEHGRSFPRTMWARARRGEATRVVADQIGKPTATADLAGATWRLLARGARGVLHVANAGTATWYDVAAAVFARAGQAALLAACATADFPTPARRPRWSVLDTTRAERLLGAPLPHWRTALDRFLDHLATLDGSSRKA